MLKTTTFLVFIAFALLSGPITAQELEGGRTYVLVHGRFGSITGWYQVERLLSEEGHRVYLASLTGHGIRRHLQSPEVDLETHILDVVNLIEVRDLSDIYLVGHSYGGMVITGVWDRVRERIKHVIYSDAFVPKDGEAVSDLTEGRSTEYYIAQAVDGLLLPPGRLAHPPSQSVMTMIQPVSFTNGPLPMDTPRTDLRAIGNEQTEPVATFAPFAEEFRSDPNWNYFEIETGHAVPIEDPAGLAAILLGLE